MASIQHGGAMACFLPKNCGLVIGAHLMHTASYQHMHISCHASSSRSYPLLLPCCLFVAVCAAVLLVVVVLLALLAWSFGLVLSLSSSLCLVSCWLLGQLLFPFPGRAILSHSLRSLSPLFLSLLLLLLALLAAFRVPAVGSPIVVLAVPRPCSSVSSSGLAPVGLVVVGCSCCLSSPRTSVEVEFKYLG